MDASLPGCSGVRAKTRGRLNAEGETARHDPQAFCNQVNEVWGASREVEEVSSLTDSPAGLRSRATEEVVRFIVFRPEPDYVYWRQFNNG